MKTLYVDIQRTNNIPVEDLRKIAWFNGIIKPYKKMCVIEKRNSHV